jgi:diguanylate cyclase (GGDEF)-like protein
VVEIVLSCINNVRLMDHANFQRYLESKPYKCIGGRIEKSPVRFTIPLNGQWHVVVDKIGFQTLANSNVRAIAPAGSKSASSGASRAPAVSNNVKGVFVAERPDSEAHVVTRIMNELNTYKQIANTDMLTGLANRRAFDIKLEDVFSEPKKLPQTALIICDIDHFKSFNDTYGHAIGDTVLKVVAETLRDSLPANASPARIGGEEFAIIVEEANFEQAHLIAETARQAVENRKFIDEETGTDCGKVTISMGICMADKAAKMSELYQKSDLALYASKKGGRNRCTVFDESMLDQQENQEPAPANSRRQQGSRNPARKEIELRL